VVGSEEVEGVRTRVVYLRTIFEEKRGEEEGGEDRERGRRRMDSSETPTFASPSEEASYWRAKAGEWRRVAEAAKEELDEFQEGSKELEVELETQLQHEESKSKELRMQSNRLQLENEQLRDKLEQCSRDYHFQINELETELAEIKGIKDKLHRYVRELEQQNDDLERVKRSTLASLEDFEGRMNMAIERNAFLESELDEKENLKMAVQRLKDETRDLRSELKVLNPQVSEDEEPDNDKQMAEQSASQREEEDSNRKAAATPPKIAHGFAASHHSTTPPLTPSARVRRLFTLVRSLASRREVRAAPKAQARTAIGSARSFDHLGPYRGAGLASYAA